MYHRTFLTSSASIVKSLTSPRFFNKCCRSFSSSAATNKMSSVEIDQYFQLQKFAVVGASPDREKFGNKVLRAYLQKGYIAIPINKKTAEIEGLTCVDSLTKLAHSDPNVVKATGVSVITPPPVTKAILEEGFNLGYRWFFLQPGTHDAQVKDYYRQLQSTDPSLKVIENCVLVQLGATEMH